MASSSPLPAHAESMSASPATDRVERPPGPRRTPSNARVAIVMLLVTETMFFTGLIGAYVVLRYGAEAAGAVGWPPPSQPRLPLAVTWANTFVLMASALAMVAAVRSVRRHDWQRGMNALMVTSVLGCCFLLVQGSEWVRLLSHGLTLSSSMYGGTFYTVIGSHALHVIVAVVWLLWALWRTRRRDEQGPTADAASVERVELCAMYWYYVSALWIGLFALVYH